jgi:hypothetical protein
MGVEEILGQIAAASGVIHPAAVQPPPVAAQPPPIQYAAPPPPAAQPPAQPPPAAMPPPHAAAEPPPAAPPAIAPPAPTVHTLTPEQWAAYASSTARIAELEAAEARRAADAQAAEVRALQAKGQIEQAFNLQRTQAEEALKAERTKLAETEARAKRYALDGELARSLASFPLVAGGADQITRLIRDEFGVEAQGDTFVVRSKDFRGVHDFITATLAKPEYAHFIRAQNPGGGTAGTQGTQSAPTGPAIAAPPPGPANSMAEYVMQHFQATGQNVIPGQITGGALVDQSTGKAVPQAASSFGLRAVPRSG